MEMFGAERSIHFLPVCRDLADLGKDCVRIKRHFVSFYPTYGKKQGTILLRRSRVRRLPCVAGLLACRASCASKKQRPGRAAP